MLNVITGLLDAGTPPVTNSYESITTATVDSGGASSITFSSIPSTFKHLQIRASAFITNNLGAQFNGDTSANYTYHRLIGNGLSASAGGASTTGRTVATFGGGTGSPYLSVYVVDILDYASTTKNKVIRCLTGHDENSTTGEVALYSNLWPSTAAITSITLKNENGATIPQYSSFALYGIKGE